MKHFLGIDCGGSTTRACVIDANGGIVFQAQSGPANLASTPQHEIIRHLTESLSNAPTPETAAGCFAGLLTDADRHRALVILEQVLPSSKVVAYPDYYATLAADPHADCVLVAGTGSLVASRTEDGRIVKSGGGGPLLADHGSAFDLGRRVLNRTLLAPRPLEASPLFWEAVIEQFGTREPSQVLAAVYRCVSPAARVAKLAPTIVFDALRGIPYAEQSLCETISALATLLHDHIAQYAADRDPLNIRLAGGLWETEDAVVKRFHQAFLDLSGGGVGPDIIIERLSREPVLGAAQLARELSHLEGS